MPNPEFSLEAVLYSLCKGVATYMKHYDLHLVAIKEFIKGNQQSKTGHHFGCFILLVTFNKFFGCY